MSSELPRIKAVSVPGPLAVVVVWTDGATATVNLAGWVATGGDILAPLNDAKLFEDAHVAEYGTSVAWGDDDELLIDAEHLRLLAAEQRPIDVAEWQKEARISNHEAAEMLGVSLSTWNAYKADKAGKVPRHIAMALRAALRDPLIMQAHYRPRKAGRPKREVAA
jgi:hypothetical protein